MSLKSLIASMTLCVFLTSFCLAEGVPTAPGSSLPVDVVTAEEETIPLVLDSAPVEPVNFISMTDVQITPSANTAEVVFTTNIPTYATIEYGLTAELGSAVMAEAMTAHVETLSGLTACRTYSYRVLATDADDFNLDTAREGTFKTIGCVAKKSTPVVKKSVPTPTPAVEPVVQPVDVPAIVAPTVMTNEEEIVLNAAPKEMTNEEGRMNNADDGTTDATLVAAPESPDMPELISEPIDSPESRATETALALLGLLLLVGALIVVRRKK